MELDPEKMYLAHVMDEKGNISSSVLDIQAPVQAGTDVESFYDSAGEEYRFSLNLQDRTFGWAPPDPIVSTDEMLYVPHGIRQWGWAVGPAAGNPEADTAAKEEVMAVSADGLQGVEEAGITDGAQGAYAFRVGKAVLEAQAGDATAVIWIYAKDNLNNTMKLAVPISENLIDVEVPVSVSIVAIKGMAGDAAARPRLLAPTCYIVNNGQREVRAEVVQFEGPAAGAALSFVEKTTGFAANEISISIAPPDTDSLNVFTERNVMDGITARNPLVLGSMRPSTEAGRGLNFTFKAAYDAVNIPTTNDWISTALSYRFQIVPAVAPVP